MDKQNLLTIGNLSKQTGVHIKSLRYYEQLGILRPAHTDPDTGYRYYTLSQIPVVDAIRACTFLDIPLKEFTSFLTEDQQRIHYKKLISHGTMLAHQKIRDIQEKLHLLEKSRSRWTGWKASGAMRGRPSTPCRKNIAGRPPMPENSTARITMYSSPTCLMTLTAMS